MVLLCGSDERRKELAVKMCCESKRKKKSGTPDEDVARKK